jgi:inhibitor of KinA sporulation pathway (predicted exonuclease)
MRDQNYLALDLEYNSNGSETEDIIEVGLACGSPKNNNIIRKSFLVKPRNKKVTLYPFITELTGITQEEYDENSVLWEDVVEYVRFLHQEYKPFANPVTWGIGDAYDMKNTIKNEELNFPFFGRRIIDVKHLFLFIEAAKGRSLSGGLKGAMGKHKITFQGKSHRAESDAFNTLRFFFFLLRRQNILEDSVNLLKTLT